MSSTPSGSGYVAVAAGARHSLALTGDGSLVSWGGNSNNLVSNTPAGSGYTAIAAGGYHSVAIAAVTAVTPSATAVVSDGSPSGVGVDVAFTATASPRLATGDVEVFDGGTSLGNCTLAAGSCTLTAALAEGSHTLTAVYGGDSNYLPSTSDTLDHVEIEPSFPDVPGDWLFFREVEWLKAEGITTGWDDGTYKPWDSVTRDAMAAFLYRLSGEPLYEEPAVSPFADIDSGTPFYKEICWLASTGISTGWTDPDGVTKRYHPGEPISRDAMAAFMYRLAGEPVFAPPAGSPFTDVDAVSSSFYTEITWLASTGITTGWTEADGSRTFRPWLPIARDAMAAFMYRYVDILGVPTPG